MQILIVDDEFHIRKLISSILLGWGYEVFEAENTHDAFEIIEKTGINFLITDWMMGETTGLELCKQIRNSNLEKYVYIILLTSKTDKNELVEGMESGADDFIGKPFNVEELKVKIKAGERILNLESELKEKNKKLEKAYETISNDLKYASKLQKSILPSYFKVISKDSKQKSTLLINNIDFDWIYLPSAFVSGDIFNLFRLDEYHIGVYHIDVSGHGIPASMMSVILSRMLLPFQSNFLKSSLSEEPFYNIISPAKLLENLNNYFCKERDSSLQYFTIVYMIIDIRDGKTVFSSGGHTSPMIIKSTGEIKIIDATGFPVGLIEDVEYEEQTFILEKGDRIISYSDGIIECANHNDEQFSEERLTDTLKKLHKLSLKDFIIEFKQDLVNWRGNTNFEDDLSLLALDIF